MKEGQACWTGKNHQCKTKLCRASKCSQMRKDYYDCTNNEECVNKKCEHINGHKRVRKIKLLFLLLLLILILIIIFLFISLSLSLSLSKKKICIPKVGMQEHHECWNGRNHLCSTGLCRHNKCTQLRGDRWDCTNSEECASGKCDRIRSDKAICIPKGGLPWDHQCWDGQDWQCAGTWKCRWSKCQN